MIGVSPAYFISRFGDRFNTDQVAEALKDLSAMGFRGFQLEVFHAENLGDWLSEDARRVCEQSRGQGLEATQFVAHFMLHAFADAEQLFSNQAYEQMHKVLDIVAFFTNAA